MNPRAVSEEIAIEQARQLRLHYARSTMLGFTLHTKREYEINWHHRALCRVLDRFARGEIRFLMVFMPPRHGKSELVSRRLPAFLHGLNPDAEIMAGSYSDTLASDMCVDAQRIMDTPEYREIFPRSRITPEGSRTPYVRNSNEHEILPLTDAAGNILEKFKGTYRGQGVGGAFTGMGANYVIIDDPIKGREQADSEAFREKLWKWYNGDLRTRLEKGGQILITLTRWHEDDLAGRLLSRARADAHADQFEVFNFPAIKEDMLNPLDIRQIGEPLWESKYPLKELRALKAGGERDWLSLFQQRPTAQEGNILKRNWWKYYTVVPARFHEILQSWDFSVKDTNGADYTVGQVWGRIGPDKYLLDQVRDRADFPKQVQMLRNLSARWPQARRKLIEDKANGSPIMSSLKRQMAGMVAIEPKGDKVARVNAVTPDIQSGNTFIPDKSIAPWIEGFVEECSSFPNGKNDDQVDAMSQALNVLMKAQTFFAPQSGHGML